MNLTLDRSILLSCILLGSKQDDGEVVCEWMQEVFEELSSQTDEFLTLSL